LTRTIPATIIAEIRQAADIVEIVSESVPLRKAGKDFSGLCPFHGEKTPSFSVSPDKQLFYCFGCGEGGDIFHFVMRREGVPFAEAVRMLGRRLGIQVEDRDRSPEDEARARERERMLWIHREAAAWFRNILTEAPEGDPGRRYLDRRGVSPEMRETFALGYAPDAWDRLLAHFGPMKVPPEALERAGLVLPRKGGNGHYDRFRGRIVFPIMDARGKTVAFGGRVLDDKTPKYLNSPETELFGKRRFLYGQHAARRTARDTGSVFVTEGYLDAISLHQFGISNAVATLGTALTEDHVRRLRAMTERAVLVFDADAAGHRAAERSVPIFVREGMPVFVLLLEPGADPDAFVRRRGADAFRALAAEAREGIPFLADLFLERYGHTVAGKSRAAAELAPILSDVADPVARPLYVEAVARRIGVPEAAIRERMAEGATPSVRSRPADPIGERRTDRMGDRAEYPAECPSDDAGGRENARASSASRCPASRRWRLERLVAAMLLQYPPARALARERNPGPGMEDERLRAIVEESIRRPEAGADEIAAALADASVRRLAASLAFAEEAWTPGACRNLLIQMEGARPRGEDSLLERIEAARRRDDPASMRELLREKMKQSQARKGCA
jgi:DNA primase